MARTSSRRRVCKLCKSRIVGRTDKVFCTSKCKTSYHRQLRATNPPYTEKIDRILHRNRTILLDILGKNKTQIKVPVHELEKRNFNFHYITKYIVNKQGKTYNYVYDFSWMTFSNDTVLINRRT